MATHDGPQTKAVKSRYAKATEAAGPEAFPVWKHTQVGEIARYQDGEESFMETFAKVAMRDAQDDMRSDAETRAVYEVEDAHAKTTLVIKHVPHNQPS